MIAEVLMIYFAVCYLLFTLDSQETVAWVFVDFHVAWQVSSGFWSFVLTEVVNGLLLATAQGYFL